MNCSSKNQVTDLETSAETKSEISSDKQVTDLSVNGDLKSKLSLTAGTLPINNWSNTISRIIPDLSDYYEIKIKKETRKMDLESSVVYYDYYDNTRPKVKFLVESTEGLSVREMIMARKCFLNNEVDICVELTGEFNFKSLVFMQIISTNARILNSSWYRIHMDSPTAIDYRDFVDAAKLIDHKTKYHYEDIIDNYYNKVNLYKKELEAYNLVDYFC